MNVQLPTDNVLRHVPIPMGHLHALVMVIIF
jgi:hypothetical protein